METAEWVKKKKITIGTPWKILLKGEGIQSVPFLGQLMNIYVLYNASQFGLVSDR